MLTVHCTNILKNNGHLLHEVGRRQKNRKIKELKTRAERALWFLETFGLTLQSITMKDVKGKSVELECGEKNERLSFDTLPEDQKETIRALLYIMDKWCVGDAAYHEMSMLVNDVPHSYLIKQSKNLNSTFHIKRGRRVMAGVKNIVALFFCTALRNKLNYLFNLGLNW